MTDKQTTQSHTPVAKASDTLHLWQPRPYWLAALPIPALIAFIIGLWLADLPATYDAPNLNIFLNFVFTALISLFIAVLTARSYLSLGQPALMVLGAGVLVWSASGIISLVFGQNDPNTIITIHNLCVLLSALFHFCSSLLAVRSIENEKKDTWLAIVYTVSIALVALITIAVQAGWTPLFFIQGHGGTPVRHLVLVASIAMFSSSAVIMALPRHGSKPAFSTWYAMALLLIATGLFGITVQSAYSSLVGWAGRIAQYLGSIYMLIAAFAALHESGAWQVSLEKQLSHAWQDYINLLELAADGILVYEPENDGCEGRLLQVNPALCQLLGYDANELLSMTPADIIAPECQSSAFTQFHRTDPDRTLRHESCLKSKDGDLIPVEISTHFFRRQRCPRGLSIIRDITERKRVDEALRESDQRFRFALRGGDVIIAMCDRKLRYIWIYEPHPDFKASSVIGKHDTEIADNDGVRQLEALKRKVFDTGVGARSEVAFPISTGTQIFDIQAEPHFNGSGSVEAVTTIAVDITIRKKAEDELRLAWGRLQLLNETLEQKVAERTALAESRAKQLQALAVELIETEERERRQFSNLLHEDLQQILAAARMQVQAVADKLFFEPMLLSVADLLEESIAKSRRLSQDLSPALLHQAGLIANLNWLAKQMKERFDLHVELDVNSELLMERTPQKVFLFRTVQELLFNVVKHADVKSAKVEVASSEDSISLTVSDQGKGFNPDMLIKSVSGAGLGLLTIKERASYIGGTFTIESSPGQGCRFILSVPNAAANGYVEMTPEKSSLEGLKPPRSQPATSPSYQTRVLFVDDHRVMRQGLIGLVKNQPTIHVVGEASNGLEALEQARKLNPDVIVMDISMPEMDGVEATSRIKAEFSEIRVIALSMHEDEDIIQKMFKAGAESFISKTVSSAELIKAICGSTFVD